MKYVNDFRKFKEASLKKKPLLSIVPETSNFTNTHKILKKLGIPHIIKNYGDSDLLEYYQKVKEDIAGILIHGGPLVDFSQLDLIPSEILDSEKPKFGICLGLETIGKHLGCSLVKMAEEDESPEGGFSLIDCKLFPCELFEGIGDLPGVYPVPFSHKYRLDSKPDGAKIIASSIETPVAGFFHKESKSYCVQFGFRTTMIGDLMLSNFYNKICKQ